MCVSAEGVLDYEVLCVSVCLTLGPRPVCQLAHPLKVLQDRFTPSNMFKHGHGGAQDRSGDGKGRDGFSWEFVFYTENKRVESVAQWLCGR